MNRINQLSDERRDLYRLAGKQHLSSTQQARIPEITNQLEVLWDQYRREVASERRPQPVEGHIVAA
ncbi:MAG TPA: hypothetical protein VHD90_19675 [Phototrophicaceae bacterium]|nr:hypothetical protein [Phototrophicaceae bacterium]